MSLSSKHVEAFSLRERSRRRLLKGSRGPQESHQGGRVYNRQLLIKEMVRKRQQQKQGKRRKVFCGSFFFTETTPVF